MMQFAQTARVLLPWCLILLQFGSGHAFSTNFTKKPPSTVVGILHSNVTFHWIFVFGSDSDWGFFSEIQWGRSDGDKIRDKYITVYKDGSHKINEDLVSPIKDRLFVTANVSRNGCNLKFVLKNVTWADERITYACLADLSGDGYKSGPIELDIQVPPKITSRSNATVNVEEHEDVKLLCEATGDPKPFTNWTKGHQVLQISNTATVFRIPDIELKDGGSYACTASNPAGSAFYSVFVRVVRYRPYVNKTASSNATVKSWLNHVTRLKCAVDANPAANFTWFKDGRPILNGVSSAHDISTLTLRPNTTGDFGHYFCKAANVKGTAWYNTTVKQLFPPGPPVINKLVPDILSISATWNRSRDDGGSPILDYKITLFEVNADKQQRQSVVTGNNYTLRSLKHNRTYKIVIQARNVVGYGKSANATVATLEADPPRVLSVTAVPSLLAVNISWNSTNDNTGVKILSFRVLLIDTVTQQRQEFTGINVSRLYIANLTHNRTYVIKVQARNEDGYGRLISRTFTTLEAEPPGVPVIKVFPLVLALQLTWNSSAQDVNNIKILDYRVKVLDGTNIKRERTGITKTSILIENLARNRTYIIEIQARNEVGYGEIASISATTLSAGPPDAPLITNITVDGKQCLLQWTKPYNGESPIEIYTVTVWLYRASNGSDFKETPNFWNTTETTYSLVDLQWNQNYKTAVSAWNKYGQSFYGRERRFTTGKFHQGLTSTIGTELLSTSPSITGDVTSPKETPTSFTEYTNENEDRTKESGAKKEGKPTTNSFIYLAPLWVVIMAFAVPAVVFVFWKATQKFLLGYCCKGRPRPGRRRELHNRTSESSVDTMDDVKDKTLQGTDHYETITEILELHFNRGYTEDAEERSGNGQPEKPNSVPEVHVYNHLHETSLDSGLGLQKTPKKTKQVGQVKPIKQCHKEMKSGLGLFPNHEYSHLIHSDSFSERQSPVPNEYSTIPSRCQWEISRDRLKLQRTIGCGEFGVVKKGLALNVNQKAGWIPVAVKTLNDNEEAKELCRKDLLSELKLMKGLSPHKHVVQLLACITESEPLYVITEFAPYGDLLGFLRKKRGLKDDYYNIEQLPRGSFTSQQLMQFAWEIADGMAYLSSEKIIHRDLAARNVLLGDNLTCKVTDFGMARDIRRQDMYRRNTGGRLPVKWTAIEALLHGLYTTKSDVWSFGVVLFEIVTIGGSPYPGMEVLELIDNLESGYRMEKPRHAADEVYALMLSCWNEDPGERPTFRQLHSALKQLANENEGCISLKTYDGRLYENVQTPSR